jgi:hypothetical protein
VDTTGRRGPPTRTDSTSVRDTTARDSTKRDTTRDTVPHYLPVPPEPIPPGPLPRGSRYTFTADSFVFSDTRTLADLLARIPGVYVARGGIYGQAEVVLYGGRGPAALEVYWDGVPYLPLGRDSVYFDAARIPLAPLERVDVIVLPAMLRVYLVSLRQRSTAPATEIGITTGALNTSGYRGEFLKRWASGLGLSLVADWNDIIGATSTSTTAFHDVDLWLKGEYTRARAGVSFQILSSDWNRSGNTTPLVNADRTKRLDDLLRVFWAARADGYGPRLDLTLARAATSHDSAVADHSLSQASLELSDLGPRAAASVVARLMDDPSPFQLAGQASWSPFDRLTVSVDARHTSYSFGRSGDRAHVAAGLLLPFGFSAHGDAAWGKDLAAPARQDDTVQTTSDLYGGLRWERHWATLEVGGARRGAFTPPPEFASGVATVSFLEPTPATNYLSVQATLHLLPGLEVSGWYFHPVRGGGDFEPPHHARYALTFYSKFWRTYRSGVFAFRVEGAAESWTGGTEGGVLTDSATATAMPQELVGATFVDFNLQLRIVGVTLFWTIRNARAFPGTYVPGLGYIRNDQFYGVRWHFTN